MKKTLRLILSTLFVSIICISSANADFCWNQNRQYTTSNMRPEICRRADNSDYWCNYIVREGGCCKQDENCENGTYCEKNGNTFGKCKRDTECYAPNDPVWDDAYSTGGIRTEGECCKKHQNCEVGLMCYHESGRAPRYHELGRCYKAGEIKYTPTWEDVIYDLTHTEYHPSGSLIKSNGILIHAFFYNSHAKDFISPLAKFKIRKKNKRSIVKELLVGIDFGDSSQVSFQRTIDPSVLEEDKIYEVDLYVYNKQLENETKILTFEINNQKPKFNEVITLFKDTEPIVKYKILKNKVLVIATFENKFAKDAIAPLGVFVIDEFGDDGDLIALISFDNDKVKFIRYIDKDLIESGETLHFDVHAVTPDLQNSVKISNFELTIDVPLVLTGSHLATRIDMPIMIAVDDEQLTIKKEIITALDNPLRLQSSNLNNDDDLKLTEEYDLHWDTASNIEIGSVPDVKTEDITRKEEAENVSRGGCNLGNNSPTCLALLFTALGFLIRKRK